MQVGTNLGDIIINKILFFPPDSTSGIKVIQCQFLNADKWRSSNSKITGSNWKLVENNFDPIL